MCVITRKEVPEGKGTPIREDAVIRTIRKIKARLGILQNNVLVVSDEALEEYKKKRSNFEKMAVVYATIAAVIVVVLIFGPLLVGGQFNIVNVLFALIFGAMVMALSLLSYVPALQAKEGGGRPPTPGEVAERLAPASGKPAPSRSRGSAGRKKGRRRKRK